MSGLVVPDTIEDVGGRVVWVDRPEGIRLRAAVFGDPGQEPVCAFLLGFTEFVEKHLETIGELRRRGYAVVVHDWRGQGLSSRLTDDRHKGHIDRFETQLEDLWAIWEAAGVTDPIPLLLGHSMGGHLGLRALKARPESVRNAVLVAPMFGVTRIGMPTPVARALLELLCSASLSTAYVFGGSGYDVSRKPFEGNRLTHDPDRFARMHRLIAVTPDLAIGDPTMGWVRAAFRSIAVTDQRGWMEAVKTPLMIAVAGEESILSNDAIDAAVQRLPNVTRVDFAEARHEILGEVDAVRAAFWTAFDEFAPHTQSLVE